MISDSGSLDLRLKNKKRYQYEFLLGDCLLPETGFKFQPLAMNSKPEIDFSGINVPVHMSKEMLSYFPKAKGNDCLALDIGCGRTLHREVCEYAGFEYVGVDYNSTKTPILGDAHSLPFRDQSFDFALSLNVIEHIRFPFVMMRETHRVLKPNGVFIGTIAFLEPFHVESYYHHTHLGVYNSLKEGGFEIKFIAPSNDWTVLIAQANLALFPKMPRFLSKSLVLPLHGLHKLWWMIGNIFNKKATENRRLILTTGVFSFIARRKGA
jgi:SAM-dependent methyltransferase